MDEEIIMLLYFTTCLACCTTLSGDIFNHQKLFNGCGIDIFEAASKITLLKHVIQNIEEEIYNKNPMNLKTLQTFDHVHV